MHYAKLKKFTLKAPLRFTPFIFHSGKSKQISISQDLGKGEWLITKGWEKFFFSIMETVYVIMVS